MATIVTRASKGSALTWTEADDNLVNINNETILNTSKISSLEEVTHSNGFDLQDPDSLGDLTYNDTTKTFTLAPKSGQPDFHYWVDGTKYVCTSAVTSAALPSTESNATYYGYLDENKVFNIVLHEDVTLPIFYKYAIVSLAYYNQSLDIAVPFEERHGYRMSSATHEKEHSTIGAVYSPPGLAITGLVNAQDTFTGITSGKIYDEDIPHIIDAHTTLPFLYRDGAGNGEWVWTAPDNKVTYMDGGSDSVWNKDTGTEWILEPADSQHDFIIHFIVVYKTLSGFSDAAIIIDQAGYSSRANARAAVEDAKDKLILDGLPSPEMVFIGAYIGKKDGELQDLADGKLYVDLRGSSSLGSASDSAPSSNAADLIVDASGFIKILDPDDTDQQKVNDKLDAHDHDDEYISLTNAVLESNLDTNGHSIHDSTGPVLIGPSGLATVRNIGMGFNDQTLNPVNGDRSYIVTEDSLTTNNFGRDLSSSERFRGRVVNHYLDLNGYDYTGGAHVYGAATGTFSNISIKNTGDPGSTVTQVDSSTTFLTLENDVAVDKAFGAYFACWLDGTSTINEYTAFYADTASSFANTRRAFQCTDSDANIELAGKLVSGELTYPNYDGTENQVLITNGYGDLSWTTPTAESFTEVEQDTAPTLGGELDTNGHSITDSTGPVLIGPSGPWSTRSRALELNNQELVMVAGNRVYAFSEASQTINNLGRELTTSERFRGHVSYHGLDINGYNYTGSGLYGAAIGAYQSIALKNSGGNAPTINESTSLSCLAEVYDDVSVTTMYGAKFGVGGNTTGSIDTYIAFDADTTSSNATNRYAFKCADTNALFDFAGTFVNNAGTEVGFDTNINCNGNKIQDAQFENIKQTVYAIGTTNGTITPDAVNGNIQTITLDGNLTLNSFANAEAGQTIKLIITQDGTGSRTLTSTMKFAGGNKTLSTAANAVDIMTVFYDGTNYWAELVTNYY